MSVGGVQPQALLQTLSRALSVSLVEIPLRECGQGLEIVRIGLYEAFQRLDSSPPATAPDRCGTPVRALRLELLPP